MWCRGVLFYVFVVLLACIVACCGIACFDVRSFSLISTLFVYALGVNVVLLTVIFTAPCFRYAMLALYGLTVLGFVVISKVYTMDPVQVITAAFATNVREAFSWFHWGLVPCSIAYGGAVWGLVRGMHRLEPRWVTQWRDKYLAKSLRVKSTWCVVFFCILGLLFMGGRKFYYTGVSVAMRDGENLNPPDMKLMGGFPLSFVYDVSVEAVQYYFTTVAHLRELPRPEALGVRLRHDPGELTIVYIVGETAMASHASLNGYYRKTTPRLDAWADKNLVSFPRTLSFASFTDASILGMMTDASASTPSPTVCAAPLMFQYCGYHVEYWSSFEEMRNMKLLFSEIKNVRKNSSQELYAGIPSEAKKHVKSLYIVYTNGSHFPYKNCYPREFAKFLPDNHSIVPSQSKPNTLINAYDNSILFMDAQVGGLLDALKDSRAIVFFVGDHGEMLGEHGIYGRNDNPEWNGRQPLIYIWMSDSYMQSMPAVMAHLKKNKNSLITHASIFHTLLGIGGIGLPQYQAEEDISLK